MPIWDFQQRAIVDTDIPTLENFNTGYQPPPTATKVDGVLDLSRRYAPDDVNAKHVKVLALARLPRGFGVYADGLIMAYTTETIDAQGTRETVRCAVRAPGTSPEEYSTGWVAVKGIAYNVPRGAESTTVARIACQRLGQKALVTLTVEAPSDEPVTGLPTHEAQLASLARGGGIFYGAEGPVPNSIVTARLTTDGHLAVYLYDTSSGELDILGSWYLAVPGSTTALETTDWNLFALDSTTYILTATAGSSNGTHWQWPVIHWDGANFALLSDTGLAPPVSPYTSYAVNGSTTIYTAMVGGRFVTACTYSYGPDSTTIHNVLVANVFDWNGTTATLSATITGALPDTPGVTDQYPLIRAVASGNGVYVLYKGGTYSYIDINQKTATGFISTSIPNMNNNVTSVQLVGGNPDGTALLLTGGYYQVIDATGTRGSAVAYSFGQDSASSYVYASHAPEIAPSNSERRIMVLAGSSTFKLGYFDIDASGALLSTGFIGSYDATGGWRLTPIGGRLFFGSSGRSVDYLFGPPVPLVVASIGYVVDPTLSAVMFRLPNPWKKASDGSTDTLLTTWGDSVAIDDAVDPGVWFGAPSLPAYAVLSRLTAANSTEWVVRDATNSAVIGSGMMGATVDPDVTFDATSAYVAPWRVGDRGAPELWSMTATSQNTLTIEARTWSSGTYSRPANTGSAFMLDDDTAFTSGTIHNPALNPNGYALTAARQVGSLQLPTDYSASTLRFRVIRDSSRRNVLHMLLSDGTNRWTAVSLNDGMTWKARQTGTPPARALTVNGNTQTGYVALGPISAMCVTSDNAPVFGCEDEWSYQDARGAALAFWAASPSDAGGHAALFFPLSLHLTANPGGDVVYFKRVVPRAY